MAPAAGLNEALSAFQRGDLDRAQAAAEQAVGVEPSAQWQHLLGLILCRRGDPAAGAEWLRRACDAEPGNIDFRIMLARALLDAGRAAEVLAMSEPPPIGSNATMALWQARGEAADLAGDDVASEKAWRAVTSAAPADWRAWANLGDVLARLDQWSAAADALRRAVTLNPADEHLWSSLVGALASAERHSEALQASTEWARFCPPTAEQAMMRGRCLLALQRLVEAETAFDEALKIAPRDPHAWIGLGLVHERAGEAGRLRALIDAAAAQGIAADQLGFLPAISALHQGDLEEARTLLDGVDPADDPMRWHRIKSRIEDRIGNHAAAFQAAAAMNRSTPGFDDWTGRSAEYRSRLRLLAAAIEGAPARDTLDPAPRTPVFLVGFPRSGTTLLDTFLMGHSRVAVLEELPLLAEAEKICPAGEAISCPLATLASAREAYLGALASHVDPQFDAMIVDKMPLNMLAVPLIHRMFPDAKFIFAQRHPCDAVLSGFMQSFVASEPMASFLTIDGAADFYDAALTLWSNSVETFPVDCRTIVYEQLVEDPRAALEPLIEFLGLQWEEAALDHRATAKSRGAIVTPSYNQVTEPLSKQPVGRWKLYRRELEPVLPLLLPWADRFGYCAG